MMHDDTNKRFQTASQALSGLSRLPIAPAWKAQVWRDKMRWELIASNRRKVVEWKRVPRQNEWTARSEPLGKGQKKTLGGSGGIVQGGTAIRQLEHFLSR
jgi:serine/threonine-protein kinase